MLVEKAGDVLIRPQKFFRGARREKGVRNAFLLSVVLSPVSLIIGMLLGVPDSVFASAAGIGFLPYGISVAVAFASAWLLNVFLPFVIAAVYHVFAMLLKGKGGYDASYRAAAYSSVPAFLLGWLWLPFAAVVLAWGFALSAIGLKELHALGWYRALAAALSPFVILLLLTLFAVLAAGGMA